MSRARVLVQARAASAPAPVLVVAYTETELAERAAYAELALLARRWRKRAAAERDDRERSAALMQRIDADRVAAGHEPFLLTRRLAAATTHPLVRYAKTLQGLRPTVVHINTHRRSRT